MGILLSPQSRCLLSSHVQRKPKRHSSSHNERKQRRQKRKIKWMSMVFPTGAVPVVVVKVTNPLGKGSCLHKKLHVSHEIYFGRGFVDPCGN